MTTGYILLFGMTKIAQSFQLVAQFCSGSLTGIKGGYFFPSLEQLYKRAETPIQSIMATTQFWKILSISVLVS